MFNNHRTFVFLSISEAYADHWCGKLEDPNGVFARCHSTVSPDKYASVSQHTWSCESTWPEPLWAEVDTCTRCVFLQNCRFDACRDENIEEYICAAVSSYIYACKAEGIFISDWRETMCRKLKSFFSFCGWKITCSKTLFECTYNLTHILTLFSPTRKVQSVLPSKHSLPRERRLRKRLQPYLPLSEPARSILRCSVPARGRLRLRCGNLHERAGSVCEQRKLQLLRWARANQRWTVHQRRQAMVSLILVVTSVYYVAEHDSDKRERNRKRAENDIRWQLMTLTSFFMSLIL